MTKVIQLLKQYQEIISYLFWGVMTTVVSWGTYGIFTFLFKNQVDVIQLGNMKMPLVVFVANVLSWGCAVVFAFVTNKLWVFQSRSWERKVWISEFSKFFSARILTGLVEIIAVPLLVGIGLDQTILGVEGSVSKVIVSIAIVLLNYIFSKLFIFKKKDAD